MKERAKRAVARLRSIGEGVGRRGKEAMRNLRDLPSRPAYRALAERATKALAVVGFFALLGAGAWGSVQAVKLLPSLGSTILAAAVNLTSIFIPASSPPPALEAPEVSPPSEPAAESGEVGVPREPSAGERTMSVHPLGGGAPAPSSGPGVDLAVKILEVGAIDTASDEFIPGSPVAVSATRKAAVRFSVENLGTERSPAWSFNASLPTSPVFVFHSDPQRELGPGDRIEFTMGFDNATGDAGGNGTIAITADPTGAIKEVTKENNAATATVKIVFP